MLNFFGPNIYYPWVIPLLTGLCLDFVQLITTLWVLPFNQFSVHLLSTDLAHTSLTCL